MTDLTAVSREDIVVGVSVSEPAHEELVRLGLSEMHVRHAFIEIVRHVLARGWSVAYGGDFRAAGYTEALFDLVRTYDRKDLSGPDRVFAYLAWPIWVDLTQEDRAEFANLATIKQVPRSDGAPEQLPPRGDRRPVDLLWSSLSLTAMREQMTAQIGARVALGGRVSGQVGLYPGVAEEAALALRAGVPLYVAAGFGGCGRAIAVALDGATPPELTVDYQLERTQRYGELVEAARSAGREPSFTAMVATFGSVGVAGLRNGLDEGDNRRLLSTDDVDEVVALILRGLRRIAEAA